MPKIQDFIEIRSNRVKEGTVQKDVSTLKAILNKAHREDLLIMVPRFPKMRRLKPRNRWLTTKEIDRLVDAASAHLKPLILFAVDTGGRLSELLGLDWSDVDLPNRQITFHRYQEWRGSKHPVL